jgi:hypothetical protein
VWVSRLEDLDPAVTFEMYATPRPRKGDGANRAIANTIGIHQAVALELRQPVPAKLTHLFEIVQAGIPTIEGH